MTVQTITSLRFPSTGTPGEASGIGDCPRVGREGVCRITVLPNRTPNPNPTRTTQSGVPQ
jgi:hypothetical protein